MAENPASTDIPSIAKALLASRGTRGPASVIARNAGMNPRVVSALEKSAVAGLTTGDGDGGEILADWRIASGAFFASLRTRSVFFRLLDSGLRRIPLQTRLGIVSATAQAWIVGEGKPIPVSSMSLTGAGLRPTTAAALLVVSDETARAMDASATNLVNAELRGAVSDVVDGEFWAIVIDTATSLGTSAGTFAEDTQALLAAVNTSGVGPLIWAMSPDVANKAATHDEDMSPLGGEILGLPAMVSSTIPAGTLRLINAAGLAGNAEPIRLDASDQATIEMETNPEMDATDGTAAELVSMWQDNSVCLRALVDFAVIRTRSNAVREIESITWAAS